MMKQYVLDTNVLIEDPDGIFAFEENEVVVPITVLIELDAHKNRHDLVGANVRKAIRNLDDLRSLGYLSDGVRTKEGHFIQVVSPTVHHSSADQEILQVARDLPEAKLISNDINLRVLAGAYRIDAAEYRWNGTTQHEEEIYSGAAHLSMDPDEITLFFKAGSVPLTREQSENLHPHQFVILKAAGQSAIGRHINRRVVKLNVSENEVVGGLTPRNKEQRFALDLLLNRDIPLVSLIGRAGCGKSLMAVAAGIQQVVEEEKYDKIIVSRPIQPMGKDLGYLPGSLEEKMAPWIQPIKDSLAQLIGRDKRTLNLKFEDGTIEIEALSYIRGRSIPNCYVIIDECQNLSVAEMKAVVTRIGVNSKIVLTGDIEQIDSHRFDSHTNGLAYLVEKMREQSVAGHITLLKGERSELATLASEIL